MNAFLKLDEKDKKKVKISCSDFSFVLAINILKCHVRAALVLPSAPLLFFSVLSFLIMKADLVLEFHEMNFYWLLRGWGRGVKVEPG